MKFFERDLAKMFFSSLVTVGLLSGCTPDDASVDQRLGVERQWSW